MRSYEKLVIIVLALFAVFAFVYAFVLNGAEAAEIHGNAQVGYVPEVESFEAEIHLQYLPWSWLSFYGGMSILMEYHERSKFSPYRNVYIVGTKVNLTENLYVDLYHHCAHLVIYDYEKQFYDEFGDGNKTKISVGIGW